MPTGPRPLRLVHLIPRDGYGGVETAARAMAERDDLACDFRLLFIEGSEQDRPRISGLGNRSALGPSAVAQTARAVLRLKPDVLVCSLWRSIPAALLVKTARPRTKLVLFFHSPKRVHLADRLTHRLALRRADAVWADSAASLTAIPARPAQERRTISFLTERLPPLPEPTQQPRFVSWGRLHPHKGVERSVALIAELHRLEIKAQLDFWGPDQGKLSKLQAQACELRVGDHIRFHGAVARHDLPATVAGAAFFLQTSHFEGFGMAAAEAMQMGLVPLVVPVGEIGRYARDGENALFVDPDDLAGSARRIAALLNDPSAFQRMRTAAIATFADQPLYPEQMCEAAAALVQARP